MLLIVSPLNCRLNFQPIPDPGKANEKFNHDGTYRRNTLKGK